MEAWIHFSYIILTSVLENNLQQKGRRWTLRMGALNTGSQLGACKDSGLAALGGAERKDRVLARGNEK